MYIIYTHTHIYIYSKSLILKKWLAVAPTVVGVPTGATLSWLAAFADREHDSPLDCRGTL